MVAAGLLHMKDGIRIPETGFRGTTFRGKPAVLSPTAQLLDLAAAHGVGLDTLPADWPVSKAAEERRLVLPQAHLVVMRAIGGEAEATIPADQHDAAESMRERVARLNGAIAEADVRGRLAPVFRRSFRFDLRPGGRHYAGGVCNVQTMSPTERCLVRMSGEPVIALDIRASLLSIFLGLTTGMLPAGDPYAVDGIKRDAVKAWTVMTMATGNPARQWSDRTGESARKVRCVDVRAAMVRAYPTLAAIDAVLPENLRASVPDDKVGWAAGQYLVGVEAAIIADAMDAIIAERGVPIPIHDGLLVATRWGDVARDAMERAFFERVGATPMVVAG